MGYFTTHEKRKTSVLPPAQEMCPKYQMIELLLALQCFASSEAEQTGELSTADGHTSNGWDVPLRGEE